MSSTEDLLANVKSAINALSNPTETQRANEWLVEFEKSKNAWEIAGLLLQDAPGSPSRFFGAKFFYSKVQHQFLMLEDESPALLMQSFVQNILRLSQEPKLEVSVCRYLCLALSALALQLNQTGIIAQILQWLNPIVASTPSILLILLTELPQEACNRQIDVANEIRESFLLQLNESSNQVFIFLSQLWPQVSVEDQIKVLHCARHWIESSAVSHANLFSQPIYFNALQALSISEGELFESSVDMILAVLRFYQKSNLQIMVETIFPRVLALRAKWDAIKIAVSGDPDILDDYRSEIFSLCRLFTETAEASLDLFAALHISCGQQEFLIQLLECADFQFDHDIARIPLKFFYELSMLIKADSTAEDAVASVANESSNSSLYQLRTIYSSTFQALLKISVNRMALTPPMLSGTVEISDSVKDTRSDWHESILDCCDVLSPNNSLAALCAILEQSNCSGPTLSDWCRIESILLCIKTICPFLSVDESTSVPQLIVFVLALPKDLPLLQSTACELLGQLNPWFLKHNVYINPVLSKLMVDVSSPSFGLAASKAIMLILKGCGRSQSLPLGNIHDHIVAMRATGGISNESELNLLEGIVGAASYLPVDEAGRIFHAAALPVAQLLSSSLEEVISTKCSPTKIFSQIERLTTLFRFFQGNDQILCDVYLQIQGLIKGVLQVCNNEAMCEKVCRLHKHVIRNASKRLAPHLSLLLDHICEQFKFAPVAAFLYAGSNCISAFSRMDNGAYVPILYHMLWDLSQTFFATYPSLDHFQQKPDVVEEYYFLVAKSLQYCPSPFVESETYALTITQAALTGLALRHREAQKGILLFFERMVQLTTYWQDNSSLSMTAKVFVARISEMLITELFKLLSGTLPAYAVDESNGSIADVLWHLKKGYPEEFQGWLRSVLSNLPADMQIISTKQLLCDQLTCCKSQREFGIIIDRFEGTCRRNT